MADPKTDVADSHICWVCAQMQAQSGFVDLMGANHCITGLLSLVSRDPQITHDTLTLCPLQWRMDFSSESLCYQDASNVCIQETCLSE